jgi:hypothetical protein
VTTTRLRASLLPLFQKCPIDTLSGHFPSGAHHRSCSPPFVFSPAAPSLRPTLTVRAPFPLSLPRQPKTKQKQFLGLASQVGLEEILAALPGHADQFSPLFLWDHVAAL